MDRKRANICSFFVTRGGKGGVGDLSCNNSSSGYPGVGIMCLLRILFFLPPHDLDTFMAKMHRGKTPYFFALSMLVTDLHKRPLVLFSWGSDALKLRKEASAEDILSSPLLPSLSPDIATISQKLNFMARRNFWPDFYFLLCSFITSVMSKKVLFCVPEKDRTISP